MENFYSVNKSESVNFVLNSFNSDIFDGITLAMRPIIGGFDYLRSMHKSFLLQRELNKISNWNFETRELFLDAMTDVVSGKPYNEELKLDLEAKISELDDINEIFRQLSQLTKNIDDRQLPIIYRLSLKKLNGRISSIRDEINSKMWDKDENVDQLLVLDQIFYLIQELVNETLNKISEPHYWSLLIFSLLYIEAFHRNKVTFENIQDYISELSLYSHKEEITLKSYDTFFEVLTV
jgi:hypothetical protein